MMSSSKSLSSVSLKSIISCKNTSKFNYGNTYIINLGRFAIICNFVTSTTFLLFMISFLYSSRREDVFEWIRWLQKKDKKIVKYPLVMLQQQNYIFCDLTTFFLSFDFR